MPFLYDVIFMKPLINILAWIAVGIIVGLAVFVIISPQQPPAHNNTNNTTIITPPANTTLPAANKTSVDLVLITAPNCDKCNQIDLLLLNQTRAEVMKSPGATVGSANTIDPSSSEAQALISHYNITLLPSLLVSSQSGFTSQDMDTWKAQIGSVESDGSLVQRLIYPPYYNLTDSSYHGFVASIAISASGCPECMNASQFADSLEQSSAIQMVFSNKTVLDENSSQAQALIAKYNITELPALFLSLDASAYPVYQQIRAMGQEKDGWFILRDVHPPYQDLARNHSIRGHVGLIQIVNRSCADCVSADTLSDFYANNAAVDLVNQTTYDANSTEAATLIKKYNLTFLPSVMFSPEISVYPHFGQIWTSQNNTIEPDGWFVFRAYPLLKQPYQNLTG